jgi:RNA-directed DNA polymerase
MTFEQYRISFTEKAISSGYSTENITRCLIYAEVLLNKDLPIIYDISHFAGLVGYNQNYITRAIIFTNHFYRKFFIPKSNGELRRISEPLPSLKDIQLWILRNILYKVETNKFAKAYKPGLTLKQNLVFHKEQPIVLSIDIKNFFSNIKKNQVAQLFISLGYSRNISDLLSKLCTLNEKLPQGAPTSPCISNLIMNDFDIAVSGFCLKNNIRYTRYADDLTFSGTFNTEAIQTLVCKELKKLALTINEDKVKVMKQGNRQVVTGVVVNEKLQVSKNKRNEIRQSVYYIKKFGLNAHLKRIKNRKSNYIGHLLGKVLFVLFLNPDDTEFKEYKSFLTELKLENNIT